MRIPRGLASLPSGKGDGETFPEAVERHYLHLAGSMTGKDGMKVYAAFASACRGFAAHVHRNEPLDPDLAAECMALLLLLMATLLAKSKKVGGP